VRRLAHRIRFGLERLILRGLPSRLLLAAMIIVIVALVAGGMVVLLDGDFAGPGDAVWWAFLRLTDPGYLGDDEGLARRAIATLVTVLGYVLFLGLLIAILTQWLNEMVARFEAGVTPIALVDHVLVLGWNHRTPTIVEELLRSTERAQRFLRAHGARQLRVVVLAEHADEAVSRELRERLGEFWNDRLVLLRSGTPLRLDHLERVAFRDAAVIILPGPGFAGLDPEYADAETVKTLASVSLIASASGSKAPLAIAEISDARRVAVARRAYGGECEIIAADDIVCRIITQSVRCRGMGALFSELLTLGRGNAIYVRQLPDQADSRFGELCGTFSRAVLLGYLRPGATGPTLAPEADALVTAEDLLVFVARSFDDCVERRSGGPPIFGRQAGAPSPRAEATRRILMLGWSRKVPELLQEFARYGRDAFAVDVVSATPLVERERALARQGFEPGSLAVNQIEARFSVPGVVESLEPARYDNIVLLASERLEDEGRADAITVFVHRTLDGILAQDHRPEILVELLEDANGFLFTNSRDDVVVSPLLVSYLLSQVALRRELGAVFTELSRSGGAQIVPRRAEDYAPASTTFAELERHAAERGEVALGIRSGTDGRLELNPERDSPRSLSPGDELMVLASDAGAQSRA
jgi:hypothetical protein